MNAEHSQEGRSQTQHGSWPPANSKVNPLQHLARSARGQVLLLHPSPARPGSAAPGPWVSPALPRHRAQPAPPAQSCPSLLFLLPAPALILPPAHLSPGTSPLRAAPHAHPGHSDPPPSGDLGAPKARGLRGIIFFLKVLNRAKAKALSVSQRCWGQREKGAPSRLGASSAAPSPPAPAGVGPPPSPCPASPHGAEPYLRAQTTTPHLSLSAPPRHLLLI